MTVITNDPIQTESSGVSALRFKADTFVVTRSVFPEPPLQAARGFADEKETFLSMLPLLHSRYAGEYVAVARGGIVDHDLSRLRLTRRFFSRFTDTPVYIGLVGARDVARVPTPFIRRSR
ncbi:MAG: hypothetical protein HY614_04050 [Candidatus Rokubacteria bacterium]|nr:hypothetical protein [Candidatus Rokubacteria bacterium]